MIFFVQPAANVSCSVGGVLGFVVFFLQHKIVVAARIKMERNWSFMASQNTFKISFTQPLDQAVFLLSKWLTLHSSHYIKYLKQILCK